MKLREFGPLTNELPSLSDWLAEAGVTHGALESTGEYGKRVFNLLERNFQAFLVNAAHVKRVLGRKTDEAGAHWLDELMHDDLLQASFIPPKPQHDL